jgi:hypothetical protein
LEPKHGGISFKKRKIIWSRGQLRISRAVKCIYF